MDYYFGKAGLPITVFLAVIIPLAGCATSPQRPSEQAVSVPEDSLTLVFVREFSFDRRIDDIKDEARILDCVRDEITGLRPGQQIVSFDRFRRIAFPDLRRESVPRRPDFFAVMLDSAEFYENIAPLGLRYVAFVGGVTETSDPHGEGICVVSPGGGGCFAYWEWDQTSRIGATILDLKKAKTVDRLEARASGKAWFAIVGIFPLGVPSATGAVACRDLGTRIAQFLGNEEKSSEE